MMVIPQQSGLKAGTQSPLKVFAGPETFDVTCVRVDNTFKSWVNTTWPTALWDGTCQGSLGTSFWTFTSTPVEILIHSQAATPKCTVRVIEGSTSNSYQISADIPVFGSYFQNDQVFDSGPSGPVFTHSGPLSLKVIPCDTVNPPAKLSFFSTVSFNTPDGSVAFGSIHIRSQTAPILRLKTSVSPWQWRHVYSFGKYDVDLIVNQSASDAWALMGCCVAGNPMGYAEFDLYDVPSAPPSPVGILQRGNAHGMDGLPSGITWTGGVLNLVSVIGQ